MNTSLWMLCGIAMIDYMGFGIVLPLLPFYAQSMGASPLQVALIIASFPAMHLVMAPIWGRISDRWGRRPLLIGGLCASTVSYLAFGLAHTLWLVAASRIVAGAAGATFAVAQAAVADVTSDTDRTVGMGYLGAANGVGVMLGPSIGGYCSRFGLGFPGFVAAGLCLANVLAALIILPETKHRTPSTPTDTDVLTWSAWIRAFRRFPLSVLVTIYFIAASTIEGIMAIFALYLERAISVGAVEVGFLWTWAGMVQIAVRGLLVGRCASRFGEPRLVSVGVGVLVCAMVLLPVMPSFPWMFVAATLYAAGAGLLFPSLISLTSRTVTHGSQGALLGGTQFVGGMGRVLGPLWSGWVFQHVGIASPFLIGAGLCGIAAWLTGKIPAPASRTSTGGSWG
jgi:MFS family permease